MNGGKGGVDSVTLLLFLSRGCLRFLKKNRDVSVFYCFPMPALHWRRSLALLSSLVTLCPHLTPGEWQCTALRAGVSALSGPSAKHAGCWAAWLEERSACRKSCCTSLPARRVCSGPCCVVLSQRYCQPGRSTLQLQRELVTTR